MAVVCAAAVVVAATEVGAVGDALTKELVGRPISVSSPLGRKQNLQGLKLVVDAFKSSLAIEGQSCRRRRHTQRHRASDIRSE
jgi:hypothetical protein